MLIVFWNGYVDDKLSVLYARPVLNTCNIYRPS